MKDDRISLKVKIKSLAEEARIIRKEENKLDCTVQSERYKHQDLVTHRKQVVRPEARKTLLAYGYIRGRTYREVEPNANMANLSTPAWKDIQRMVEKYGPQPFEPARFDAWRRNEVYIPPVPAQENILTKLLNCVFT